jgi:hypothetical protein
VELMTAFDGDPLASAFQQFTAEAAPAVFAPGTASVRATVTHRRRVRAVVGSFLGVLLLGASIGGYAVLGSGPDARPPTGTTPTATPPMTSTSPSEPPGPDGRLTVDQLSQAPVTVPAWNMPPYSEQDLQQQCPTGPNRTINRLTSNPDGTVLTEVAYANLDADSALETAAILKCYGYGEAQPAQLVGFDRDASGGIVTLGQIVAGHLWHVTASAARGVDVDMTNFQACCGSPKILEYHQTRTYAWDGTAFAQVSGPTSFTTHDKPIDLAVRLDNVEWGPVTTRTAVDGVTTFQVRAVTVTVTVTNRGTTASNPLALVYNQEEALVDHPVDGVAGAASRTITAAGSAYMFDDSFDIRVVELGGVADSDVSNNTVNVPIKKG